MDLVARLVTAVREVDVVWLFVVHIGISREIERLPWTGREFARELGSQTSDPFVPFWLSVVSAPGFAVAPAFFVAPGFVLSFVVVLGIVSDNTYVETQRCEVRC